MSDSKVKLGRSIASFLFPPVGLITWASLKDENPKKAKTYLILAGIGQAIIIANIFIRYKIKNKNKNKNKNSNENENE